MSNTKISAVYNKVINMSKDLYTICTAIDCVIETHSEDDMIEVYRETGLGETLARIETDVLKMVKLERSKMDDGDVEDRELYSDVCDNLHAFIEYKQKFLSLL